MQSWMWGTETVFVEKIQGILPQQPTKYGLWPNTAVLQILSGIICDAQLKPPEHWVFA